MLYLIIKGKIERNRQDGSAYPDKNSKTVHLVFTVSQQCDLSRLHKGFTVEYLSDCYLIRWARDSNRLETFWVKMSFYNALFYPDFKRCTFILRAVANQFYSWEKKKTEKDPVSGENGGTKMIRLSIVTMLYHPWGKPRSNLHSSCEYAKDFVWPSHQWTAPAKKKTKNINTACYQWHVFPHLFLIFLTFTSADRWFMKGRNGASEGVKLESLQLPTLERILFSFSRCEDVQPRPGR